MSHDSEYQFEVRPNAKFNFHIHHIATSEYVGAMPKRSTQQQLDTVLDLAAAAYFTGVMRKAMPESIAIMQRQVDTPTVRRMISIARKAHLLGMEHVLSARRGR